MEDDEDLTPFEEEFSRWISRDSYIPRPYGPSRARETAYTPETVTPAPEEIRSLLPQRVIVAPDSPPAAPEMAVRHRKTSAPTPSVATNNEEKKKSFALTPLDKEYYEPEDKIVTQSKLNNFLLNT